MNPLAVYRDHPDGLATWYDENIAEELEHPHQLFHLSIIPADNAQHPWKILFRDADLLRHVCSKESPFEQKVEAFGYKYEFDEYINTKVYLMFVELRDYITSRCEDATTVSSLEELAMTIETENFNLELSSGADIDA